MGEALVEEPHSK